jgi:hypothetical protein
MSDLSNQHICKSCNNVFTGLYCNSCGEKIIQPADSSFKAFLNNVLLAITFADSKLIKTLWKVIKNPGFVSNEFVSGRRIKYLKPISLFFVLNLFYFFFPVIQLFNASLKTQLLSVQRDFIKPIIAHKMVSLNMDLSSFSLVYNMKTAALAKLMVMVFVVLASLPLNLLYAKRKKYFSDHITYAVELACFNLFINAIVLTLIAKFLGLGHYLDELVLTGIFISTNLYFLIRSGITFYHERSSLLLIKSMLMILFLKLALEIYRAILFFVTIWTM